MSPTRLSAFAAVLLLSASLSPLQAQAQYQDDSETDTEASHGGNASAAARLQVRINELEEQVRRLQGAMEQTSFSNRQLKTQMDKMRGDIDYRLSALEKNSSPAPAASAPQSQNTAADTSAEDVREPNRYVARQPGQGQPPVQDKQPAATQNFPSSHEHYSYGFKLMQEAKYAEAGDVFTAFTTRYPKDPLIGHAFYWLGESYYIRKQYVPAADSFRQGYEAMPAGPKAADNLFKLATTLDVQGEDKKSCVILKQVAVKFGKTSGSVKTHVEQEMNRLECK